MATVEELTQQLQEKENELYALTRENTRLQTQLDDSRETESRLKSDAQTEAARYNDQIRVLSTRTEELETQYRQSVATVRQLEESRRVETETAQRVERELRSALLELHNKGDELVQLKRRQTVFEETQKQCDGLRKRVGDLEDMQREGREGYKAEASRVRQLEEQLSKKQQELEETVSHARGLQTDNARLEAEMSGLLNGNNGLVEGTSERKSGLFINMNQTRPKSPITGDGYQEEGGHRKSFKLDLGGDHDDADGASEVGDYINTPRRRGSVMIHDGYAEPLLKDEVTTGLSLATKGRRVDRETQTLAQMNEETDRSEDGCPKPQCVIC